MNASGAGVDAPLRLSWPLSTARANAITSLADWVKLMYSGSICCTTAMGVASV
jgi:hypothetical protein